MSLEQTIKDTVMAESVDLDMRLQQLVRAGLMPSNTIPLLRKAITKIQGGYPLQGAERDVMANFLNSMMFIVLGDDSIFNKARVGAKSYATEAKEKTEYDYEGDMAMGQLKSIIANSQRMHDMLSDDTNLPEWVQSKITLAEDYISTASNYMQGEMNEEKMPFEGPYRKVGERKDKYGNPIKNVAKHLAKKAMKAGANLKMDPDTGTPDHFTAAMRRKKGLPEDVELEEKRGLWDNIHAKRKRIKAGSGERMRKPGSEGAPSAADLKNSRVDEGNKVVANTNDPESMKKYTADVVKRARDARKALTKESRRTEALADIAAIAQMNESYKTTFDAALTQYGIKSPSELDEEKRKEFFNFVDQEYKKGDK